MVNPVLEQDISYTLSRLSPEERHRFQDSTILITGCGGFVGQYYLSFFATYEKTLSIKKVIGIDTFLLGKSPLVQRFQANPLFDIRTMDVKQFPQSDIPMAYQIDYVFHMASIASPTYYRKHPMETIDSNVWGLRVLLDAFVNHQLKGFLFYSSSEIYGDPHPSDVPTNENFWGNVSCMGPRACYDESKRFGETLCWVYQRLYNIPIRIVRLFNVYGPGLKTNDCRVPADFAHAVIENKDIIILSDGKPTRTFCYIADSTAGEIKAIMSPTFDVYNIGADSKEISILQLAQIYQRVGIEHFGYTGNIVYKTAADEDYLVHDPQRRCPDLRKSKSMLKYAPSIEPNEGVYKYLCYLYGEGGDTEW